MNDLASTFLLVYAGLFPIVNPVGSAPIFLSLTRHCAGPERDSLAGRVAVHSFFLLLGSLLIGSYVLEFFGISLPALRIAGGLVVHRSAGNCCMPASSVTISAALMTRIVRSMRSIP